MVYSPFFLQPEGVCEIIIPSFKGGNGGSERLSNSPEATRHTPNDQAPWPPTAGIKDIPANARHRWRPVWNETRCSPPQFPLHMTRPCPCPDGSHSILLGPCLPSPAPTPRGLGFSHLPPVGGQGLTLCPKSQRYMRHGQGAFQICTSALGTAHRPDFPISWAPHPPPARGARASLGPQGCLRIDPGNPLPGWGEEI